MVQQIHMPPPPPSSWTTLQEEARTLFDQGRVLEEAGDISAARRCYEEAQETIEQVPPQGNQKLHTDIVMYLGHLLVEQGDPADLLQAERLLHQACDGLRALGRVAEALDIERELLTLKSEGRVTEVLRQQGVLIGYLDLAEKRLRKGRIKRAHNLIGTAMKAIKAWGTMHRGMLARARLIRGITRAQLGKKRAEKDLSRAARYYHEQGEVVSWAEAHLWEYVYCKQQEKTERAQEILEELCECNETLPKPFQKVLSTLLTPHPRKEEHVAD